MDGELQNCPGTEDADPQLLFELEDYITKIWEFLPVPIACVTPLGVILDVDRALEELVGQTKDKLCGSLAWELFGDEREMREVHEATLSAGAVKDRELTTLVDGKGGRIPIRVSTLLRVDEATRQPSEYFMSLVDLRAIKKTERELALKNMHLTEEVEERKRVGEALKESEERYARSARGANDGLWDWNLADETIYLSSRWFSIVGDEEEARTASPDVWLQRVHPDDIGTLRRDIDAHLRGDLPLLENEHRFVCADETVRWVLVRGMATRDHDGTATRMAGSLTDITERKVAEEKLVHDAFHDGLTGLPNRALFLDRLEHCLSRRMDDTGPEAAVLFLDLDRFKLVNDSLGHESGDRLLQAVARRLSECLRDEDTIARLGGDEFIVLLESHADAVEALRVGRRLIDSLNPSFEVDGMDLFTYASVGIVTISGQYDSPADILRDADIAMYRAKAAGGSQCVLFTDEMREAADKHLRLEGDLRSAIKNSEFVLHYQPIVEIQTGRICALEALIRWDHPVRGQIPPADFIGLAEETGLITSIGQWVLREACTQLGEWREEIGIDPGVKMSVNLSPVQLEQEDLLEEVSAAVKQAGLVPDDLVLEVTESTIMDDPAKAAAAVDRLKDLGVHVHIDDFGTGYSSLSLLSGFEFDAIKIDRSFVSGADKPEPAAEIIRALVKLSESLKVEIIAEGVEKTEQLSFLDEVSCPHAQGYLLSYPLTCDEMRLLLHEGRGNGKPIRNRIETAAQT